MRKPDEIALARYVLDNFVEKDEWLWRPDRLDVDWIEDWARDSGVPFKRAYYILEKWEDRGIWNSGVTTRSGWVEEPGELREIAAEQPA